jgi:hypothetical protein
MKILCVYLLIFAGQLFAAYPFPCRAAEYSRGQVEAMLNDAGRQPAKFANKDLAGLDLSGIDFQGALLFSANLRNL